MELNEAMETAMHFEERAHQAYSEAAKHSKSSILKKTFEYLAQQEQRHIDTLKEYIKNHNIDFNHLGENPDQVRQFFDETIGTFLETATLCEEDVHAYEAGLHLERASYDFYKKYYEQVDDPEVKKFFKFLMDQESAHYMLLDKAYHFLKDPEHFHADDEQWLFEG